MGPNVNLDELSGLRTYTGGPVIKVGLLASFAKWKGHETFLSAISKIDAALPIRAYIIGGPVYDTLDSQYTMADIRDLVGKLGLGERVGLTGFIEDPAAAIEILIYWSTPASRRNPLGEQFSREWHAADRLSPAIAAELWRSRTS